MHEGARDSGIVPEPAVDVSAHLDRAARGGEVVRDAGDARAKSTARGVEDDRVPRAHVEVQREVGRDDDGSAARDVVPDVCRRAAGERVAAELAAPQERRVEGVQRDGAVAERPVGDSHPRDGRDARHARQLAEDAFVHRLVDEAGGEMVRAHGEVGVQRRRERLDHGALEARRDGSQPDDRADADAEHADRQGRAARIVREGGDLEPTPRPGEVADARQWAAGDVQQGPRGERGDAGEQPGRDETPPRSPGRELEDDRDRRAGRRGAARDPRPARR